MINLTRLTLLIGMKKCYFKKYMYPIRFIWLLKFKFLPAYLYLFVLQLVGWEMEKMGEMAFDICRIVRNLQRTPI